MQASNAPTKIQTPFADSGDKQTIPVASQIGITDGRASFTDGFPPLTRTPIVAGGVPPFGTDMNGILYDITAIQQWLSAGGRFVYDSAFAAAIGGYPKGAVLQKADGSGSWLCTAENNSTNPDTGGANWQDFSGGRLIGVQIITVTGTYTPSAGTKSVIVEGAGGGAGGGGSAATGAAQYSMAAGGSSGAYGRGRFTSGFSGVTVTIGAAGAAGAIGGNGGNGGTTSFGALLSFPGGVGGTAGVAASSTTTTISLGVGGVSAPSGANLGGSAGARGGDGVISSIGQALSGAGGNSPYGSSGARQGSSGAAGGAATGYGSGGAGGGSGASQSGFVGGAGSAGIVIVWEYA